MAEVEATLNRIKKHDGVVGYIVVNKEGTVIRKHLGDESQLDLISELIPNLASLARNMVRDLDPQNDLEFLRIRSDTSEIMVAPHPEYCLIVIQNPPSEGAPTM